MTGSELTMDKKDLLNEVSRLRQRNAELEAESKRMRQIFTRFGHFVWTADAEGRLTMVSQNWAAHSEEGPETMLDRGWMEVIHPEDRERVLTSWREALWGKNPYNCQYRVKKADGRYKWSHAFAAPLFDRQGELSSWIGINIDIHDQKVAGDALRSMGETSIAVADQLFDGIHMISIATMKSIYINPSLVRLIGFSAEEARNLSLGQITNRVHPEDRSQTIKAYQQVFDGSAEEQDLDLRWQVKSGGYRWLNVRHKVIFDSQGKLSILLQVIRDITEKKESERKQKIIDQLRQSDENRSQFLSIMSHELRNPLASIIMGIEIQKRVAPDSEEAWEARQIIERQAEQLSRLVNDLLDISRISQKSALLKKEMVDLNELIQQAVSDFKQLFTENGVKLSVILCPKALHLQADSVRFLQTISNLLHNALKFTNKNDEVLVTVAKDTGKQQAVIRIKDTGSGIQPDLLPHLFHPFVQGDHSLARSSGGLGLGLAIAKQMVELHDGSIDIASGGLGKGTQVTIRVPLAAVAVDPPAEGTAEISPAAPTRRILIIDDIPDITSIVSSLLELMGHKTYTAGNGAEGLKIAQAERPDVILCDIGLPDMSGYEVAQFIRQDRKLRGIRLIALSGYAQEKDLEQSRAAGFDQHLAKPVNAASLEAAIAQNA